jgi:small subunit ribosomal protein S6
MAQTEQAGGAAPQAAAAGKARLREYETVFLVKPDLTDETVDKLKERIRAAVNRDGGKVLKFTHWGKKKTAFPVQKQLRAVYVHVSYLGNPGIVAEVERNLAIAEDVTKYLSQHLADDVDPDTRAVEADVKLAGDADERARPEREGAEGGEREGRGERGDRDRDRDHRGERGERGGRDDRGGRDSGGEEA